MMLLNFIVLLVFHAQARPVTLVNCLEIHGDRDLNTLGPSREVEGLALDESADWIEEGEKRLRGPDNPQTLVGRDVYTLNDPALLDRHLMADRGFEKAVCFKVSGEPVRTTRIEKNMLARPSSEIIPASALENIRFVLPTVGIGFLSSSLWSVVKLEPRLAFIREKLGLCGVEIRQFQIVTLTKSGFDSIFDDKMRNVATDQISDYETRVGPLAEGLPRPLILYVRNFKRQGIVGISAQSYPSGSVLSNSPLLDVAIIPQDFMEDEIPGLVDLHELTHILLSEGGHVYEHGNILGNSGNLGPNWREDQCERLRGSPLVVRETKRR